MADKALTNNYAATPAAENKSEWRFWYIAVFGFFLFLNETGVRQVLNIFIEPITHELNCTRYEAKMALVVIPTSSSLITGPFAAMFYQRFGPKAGIISGGLISAAGFALNSVAASIQWMYTFAIVIGLGCGFLRNAAISMQVEYFEKNRNFVMSFISIGPGLGIFVLPRILSLLIDTTSIGTGMLLMAASFALCSLTGILVNRKKKPLNHSLSYYTGIKVWSYKQFIIQVVASFAAAAVCIVYVSNIYALMLDSGISKEDAPKLYSYNGVGSLIGRFLLTGILSYRQLDMSLVMVFNYILAQISLMAPMLCTTFWQFGLQNFFAGFGMGLFQASWAQFLVEIVTPANLPGALGYSNLFNGIAAFVGSTMAGEITKATHSTRNAFWVCVILGTFATVTAIINSIGVILNRKRNKEDSQSPEAQELSPMKVVDNDE